MLDKLYDLVFGQKEYEKTKIEVRISLIQDLIPDIAIKKLEDFEKLEASIFKLKDQLRVKSSNLNKVANDPTRNLSRAKIDEVLTSLNSIKLLFLQKAFTIIEKVENNQIYIPSEHENKKVISIPETTTYPLTVSNDENQNTPPVEEIKVKQPQTFELDKVLITESDDAEIYLGNGIKPYLLIKFHNEINLSLLKLLSKLLFETVNPDGTNVIIEDKIAMIIPRFTEDNLFEIDYNSEIDLNETQKKIFDAINKNKSETYDEVKLPIDKEFKKKKDEDDSLDSLIEKNLKDKSDEPTKVTTSKLTTDKVTFLKDDEIEIEKETSPSKEKDEKIEIITEDKESENLEKSLILYSDDKVIAQLNKKGVLGEIIIKSVSETPLDKLNESDLSYLVLFSKVFSSVVFETTQCHGTNLVWDYAKSEIKIIPRFENDSINFSWDDKKVTPEFLTQIHSKLLETLNRESQNSNQSQKKEDKTETQTDNVPSGNNSKSSKKEKAKYLIESLKRIG